MFYYRRGEISTNTRFERPTPNLFYNWLENFKLENPELNLDLYLVGAFCENMFGSNEHLTWDIDVVLMGQVKNRSILKRALDSGFRIGLENKILVDIAWRNQILTFLSNPNDRHEKIINYIDYEYFDEDGKKMVYTIDGTVTNLFPGLFYVTDFDVKKALDKSKEKFYSVPYKKIEL